jgi:hypothetical protein
MSTTEAIAFSIVEVTIPRKKRDWRIIRSPFIRQMRFSIVTWSHCNDTGAMDKVSVFANALVGIREKLCDNEVRKSLTSF